jgi:hypothetical protein
MRTAQSKNPEDAGCDQAATGSSTETVGENTLTQQSRSTLHRDPSTRARVHARHAQDDNRTEPRVLRLRFDGRNILGPCRKRSDLKTRSAGNQPVAA